MAQGWEYLKVEHIYRPNNGPDSDQVWKVRVVGPDGVTELVRPDIGDVLTGLGAEGWELVSTVVTGSTVWESSDAWYQGAGAYKTETHTSGHSESLPSGYLYWLKRPLEQH